MKQSRCEVLNDCNNLNLSFLGILFTTIYPANQEKIGNSVFTEALSLKWKFYEVISFLMFLKLCKERNAIAYRKTISPTNRANQANGS